jgi:hypothetical protein
VQQREQSDKRLVRVAVSAGPAAQQPGLVAAGQSLAAEPAGGSVREAGCRIGEADPLLAGEAEEVTQRREPEPTVAARGEERLDVRARARRPIAHALLVEVHCELGQDREALLDRVIFERVLAYPTGALATGQQPREISLGRRAQRRGQRSIRRARGRARAGRPRRSRQAAGNEERLQQPGGVARAAAGAAAVADRSDHPGWPVSPRAQRPFQATQVPHADRWRAALQQPVGERTEPLRAAFCQTILGALDPHADPRGVALIARVAQPVGGVAAQLTAAPTAPRYAHFFGLSGDFAGYVEFFHLQDLVDHGAAVVEFFMPFEDFTASPLPGTLDAYFAYRQRAIEFIASRNHRIAAYVDAWPPMRSAAKAVIAGGAGYSSGAAA